MPGVLFHYAIYSHCTLSNHKCKKTIHAYIQYHVYKTKVYAYIMFIKTLISYIQTLRACMLLQMTYIFVNAVQSFTPKSKKLLAGDELGYLT